MRRPTFSHAVFSRFGGGGEQGEGGAPFYVVIILRSLAGLSDLFPFALENDIK